MDHSYRPYRATARRISPLHYSIAAAGRKIEGRKPSPSPTDPFSRAYSNLCLGIAREATQVQLRERGGSISFPYPRKCLRKKKPKAAAYQGRRINEPEGLHNQ
uniref:Uncharacterized protein n=1 Tax=Kalanchoe fedtschenkoi TaxID=63787 RepID=A0A7N0U7D9_KALFE